METYRVVIADEDAAARAQARQALESANQTVVGEAESRDALAGLIGQVRPDVVLLDATLLPDGADESEPLPPTGSDWSGPFLVMTDGEGLPEGRDGMAERISLSGAFGTVAKPVRPEEACAALHIAVLRFRDLHGCQESLDKLQTRLADRIVIERAKGLLMQAEGLSEEEAFKRIHFDARRRNRTMRSVAEEVLAAQPLSIPIPPEGGATRNGEFPTAASQV